MVVLFFTATLLAQSLMGGSLPIDGISCDRQEGALLHIHTHVELFDKGRAVGIPADIGFSEAGQCLYWIHTHTPDGYVHIEAPVKRTFTLGQFFDIWDQSFSWTTAGSMVAPHGKRLSIWVNGKPWHGSDPRDIPLADRETIVIQNGPPFARPTPSDWSKL
ncbi:MAG TPA: hypothetical protein VMF61_06435 [Candidatus Acidoferrales bacterium]|nr:hypothetical protein [Candidatus Acidoferrales bacterium]